MLCQEKKTIEQTTHCWEKYKNVLGNSQFSSVGWLTR